MESKLQTQAPVKRHQRNDMPKRLCVSLGIATICLPIVMTGTVMAAGSTTTFGQKILPLDCVFQVVNVGTGELRYLTPAACGQVLPPSPAVNPKQTSQATQQQYSQPYGTNREIFFVPNNASGNEDAASVSNATLPWQPIATITQKSKQSPHAGIFKFSIPAIAGTIVVIIIIVFLVLFML
jgi:hypothetical protein